EGLPNMGDTPLGLISAGTYSVAGKRPANEAFLALWRKEYGEASIPDFLAVDGYDAMAAIFDLVKATKGKFTADEAMAFFKTWKPADSPRGPIAIDPETRDIIQNVYMRRVEKVNGKLANVEFETIPQVKDPWKELNPAKCGRQASRIAARVFSTSYAATASRRGAPLGRMGERPDRAELSQARQRPNTG